MGTGQCWNYLFAVVLDCKTVLVTNPLPQPYVCIQASAHTLNANLNVAQLACFIVFVVVHLVSLLLGIRRLQLLLKYAPTIQLIGGLALLCWTLSVGSLHELYIASEQIKVCVCISTLDHMGTTTIGVWVNPGRRGSLYMIIFASRDISLFILIVQCLL